MKPEQVLLYATWIILCAFNTGNVGNHAQNYLKFASKLNAFKVKWTQGLFELAIRLFTLIIDFIHKCDSFMLK